MTEEQTFCIHFYLVNTTKLPNWMWKIQPDDTTASLMEKRDRLDDLTENHGKPISIQTHTTMCMPIICMCLFYGFLYKVICLNMIKCALSKKALHKQIWTRKIMITLIQNVEQ